MPAPLALATMPPQANLFASYQACESPGKDSEYNRSYAFISPLSPKLVFKTLETSKPTLTHNMRVQISKKEQHMRQLDEFTKRNTIMPH